ncbi:hypothetical protein A1O3_04819 [Capronia epimyces CBS 606.96]|uniref:Uncharacterized protein n=1 Tax=Capronia epimyces CBS 606.96 TaxID=1182542 RepID=W9XUA6_9EURO|nr:uncharacterized protein A1O3_04819 [Capronia epimyces CBS 606.96]EXJ84152.1 hypothetical protein A1O3_04819 [Capronia epimyces CBS 606.96]
MVLPRSSALRGSIRSFTLKRVGAQARTNLRAVGRRGYASEHGAKKSSDIPWLIGSVAVTVPAATWLLSQGPKKSDHGHGHEEHTEEPEEESKEGSEDKAEEAADEGAQDGASETSEGETPESSESEGEGEVSEKKGDKDAQKDESGASNPLLDDDEKSKKPEGPAASAKITGTVDPSRSTSGGKGPETPKEE